MEEGQASLLQLFNTAIEVENWVEKLYKEATVQYDTDKASRGALWNFTDGLDTKLEGLKDLIDSQQAFLDMHPDKVRQRGSADTVAGPSTSSGTQIGSQQRGSAAGPEVINESQAQANLSGQPEPVIYQGQDVDPSKTLFLPGQRTPTEEDWKKVEAVEHSCEELPVLGLCGGCEERNTGLWCNVKDGSPCSNCVGLRKLCKYIIPKARRQYMLIPNQWRKEG